MTITEQIRAEMERQDITISELARRAELSRPQTSSWMAGRKTVTIETAEAAANALGCELVLRPVRS